MEIKREQIIALTRGSDSDYEIVDYCMARREFDTDDVLKKFKAEGPHRILQQWGDGAEVKTHGSDNRFISWLISEFYLRPMKPGKITEWLIGEGGEVIDGGSGSVDDLETKEVSISGSRSR